MGFAEGIDEPYAIVEIGDIMLLAKEIACRTIGKNVVVKIAVEVTGNITTGEGKDDFIVELGVDGKRTTGDIEGSVSPLFGILEDGHETWGFERELVGSKSASEPFKIGLLLVKVVKGLPLFLKAFVAADGKQEGFLGIFAGIMSAIGQYGSLRRLYPSISGRHQSAEFLACGKFGKVAVFIKMMMGLTPVTTSALCAFFDEQVDEHLIGGEFEQGWYRHGFLHLRKGLWRKADMMFNMHPRLVTGDGDRTLPKALTYES